MRLSEAKRKYRGQWLAFSIRREKDADPEGTLVAHAKSRHELHRRLQKRHIWRVYLTFAGPPVRPGYAVVFVLT